ncbi:SLATT domain-containing protein [Streptomyces sp. NRRL F-5123]|uniref:SLATT domain-containing protein n=1 Tax=Streptomyces sp. NRRL F-5123 TaxID=1463856 RepID=UPI0004E150E6|nr:SLATT domain-containing protein [Streptomyces sp. NRRL F-5123]
MAGRGATAEQGAREGGAPAAPRGQWRRGDLQAQPFPAVPVAAATDPAVQRETLARLREWAELDAETAIAWYLDDKRLKRIGSRLLQGLAIACAVAGAAVPLGTAAAGGSGQGWGYVLLAVAAGCKGFDHYFGLSAAWMRDITVAHALRTELNAVRLEWATDMLRAGPAAADPDRLLEPAELERQLALVARLAGSVRARIDGETADWQAEFSAGISELQGQRTLPGVER